MSRAKRRDTDGKLKKKKKKVGSLANKITEMDKEF